MTLPPEKGGFFHAPAGQQCQQTNSLRLADIKSGSQDITQTGA